jgi:hypothetical protein
MAQRERASLPLHRNGGLRYEIYRIPIWLKRVTSARSFGVESRFLLKAGLITLDCVMALEP